MKCFKDFRCWPSTEVGQSGQSQRESKSRQVLQTSRSPFSDYQPQHQTQIEPSDMDQQSFENVLTAAQMHPSQSTRLVTMCKRPLQHQSSTAQQSFSSLAANAPAIGVHRSPFLVFADPISPTSIRL